MNTENVETGTQFVYVMCNNCAADDGIELDFATEEDPTTKTHECYYCGAVSEVVPGDSESFEFDSVPQYCRHNRVFEENCVRCEVEGLEFPK